MLLAGAVLLKIHQAAACDPAHLHSRWLLTLGIHITLLQEAPASDIHQAAALDPVRTHQEAR